MSRKKAKDPSHHGRGAHRPGGGCDTGRRIYKRKADAGPGGERCDRCKFFHAADDHPRRRR